MGRRGDRRGGGVLVSDETRGQGAVAHAELYEGSSYGWLHTTLPHTTLHGRLHPRSLLSLSCVFVRRALVPCTNGGLQRCFILAYPIHSAE